MALERAALEALALAYLERQPWYLTAREQAGDAAATIRPALLGVEELAGLPAGLARLLLRAGGQHFQLLVGWRPATDAAVVLRGREASLLGPLHDGEDEVLAYDALADPEQCLALLAVVTGGTERAERARHVDSLVSHASLVFDERLLMKCYRVLMSGTRPEVELLYRLDEVGFNAMLAPVARWRGDGFDTALVREFVANGIEARELALTSLRDLLASATGDDGGAVRAGAGSGDSAGGRAAGDSAGGRAAGDSAGGRDPDEADATAAARAAAAAAEAAGGDLASEMHRLGATTASLHLALVAAFGERPLAAEELARRVPTLDVGAVAPGAPVGGLGSTIRVHGDYHLRRVMRTEAGWLVAGFGDDPLYGEQAGRPSITVQHGSPLEDLADLCFALVVVAEEAVARRPVIEGSSARRLASAWVRRNREAFLDGYRSLPAAAHLLPGDAAVARLVLDSLVTLRAQRYEAAPAAG